MNDSIIQPGQLIVTDLAITDTMFVKSFLVPKAGSLMPQHVHVFAHISVIAAGGVRVWEDGLLKGEYQAPETFVIAAHKKHMFLTLADNTVVLCVHDISATGDIAIEAEHQLTGPG
jgi:quercetin dioxygenase-like cupin family protein